MRLFLPFLPIALFATIAQAQPDSAPSRWGDVNTPVQPAPPLPGVPRTGTPQEQIKSDVKLFLNNLNAGTAFMGNNELIFGVNTGYFGANEWSQNWREQKIQIKLDDIKVEKVEGKQATATVTYHIGSELVPLNELLQTHSQNGLSETFKLRKQAVWDQEHWQIIPPEKLNPADTETGILAYVTYVLAQKGEVPTDALPYAFSVEGTHSLNNLKQLGLGVMQFVQDYDELYSFQPQYIQEAIKPYVRTTDIFRIPATQQTYSFNTNLSGKSLAAVAEPTRTILFYEGENQQPIFRYNGKAAIAFVDGHCVFASPEDLKRAIWTVAPIQG